MKIETHHIVGVRNVMNSHPSEFLTSLYKDMAESIKPKITGSMVASCKESILSGRTYAEASKLLSISKMAVGQHTMKCLQRLVEYETMMGREVPQEIQGVFTLSVAKSHIEFFNTALENYQSSN